MPGDPLGPFVRPLSREEALPLLGLSLLPSLLHGGRWLLWQQLARSRRRLLRKEALRQAQKRSPKFALLWELWQRWRQR